MTTTRRTTTRRRELPQEPADIVKLCERVGWRIRPHGTRNGTYVLPSDGGEGVFVPINIRPGRQLWNLWGALRRHGIEAALEALEERDAEQREAEKKAHNGRHPTPVAFVAPTDDDEGSDPRGTGENLIARIITITPEMALEWLTREPARLSNGHPLRQRELDPKLVEKYRGQMHKGRWRVTHEAVALASYTTNTGGVIDGQHRLHAIIEHGKAVDMLVIINADPDTFHVVNTGKLRTAPQFAVMAALAGKDIGVSGSHVTTVARFFDAFTLWRTHPNGPLADWSTWHRLPFQPDDVIETHARFAALGLDLTEVTRKVKTFVGPPVRIHIGAVAVAHHWITNVWPAAGVVDPDTGLDAFDTWLQIMRKGAGCGATPRRNDPTRPEVGTMHGGNDPAWQLREWLRSGFPARHGGAAGAATFLALIKAWNHTQTNTGTQFRVAKTDRIQTPYKPA